MKKKWTWHHWSPTVLPTSSSRYITRAISKQNHGHMQKVTREVQLWPSWPPPLPISVLKYQGSPVTTASALHAGRARHNSDHRKHADPWTSKSTKVTGWEISRPLSDWSAYFLVAPCLCGGSPTGSGGGGTGPSRDPCRHSPVSDIDFPSCLRVKHLLERSQTINTWKCIVGTVGPTKCQSSEAQRNTKDVTKMKGSGSI